MCVYIYIYIYIHICDCVETIWITVTLQWNIFTQIGSSAKCWLDIYHGGAGLAVTGRIPDIGQNVLQSSFQTWSSSSPSHCYIFFLIPFLEEAFIRNIIIIPCINYVILKLIMEDSKTLFCSSKFPMVCKRTTAKFIDNLVTRLHKDSPALGKTAAKV
jgi:hypothetical protein